jgi:hypothetical protein
MGRKADSEVYLMHTPEPEPQVETDRADAG